MRLFITCLVLLAASCGAPQGESRPNETQFEPAGLAVQDVWIAPTPEGVSVSAGYATLTNRQSADDTLIAVESARAGRVEIHEMAMDGGVMRMRKLDALAIPAGATVTLAPGGLHIMFFDVNAPFVAGEGVDLRLRFAHAGDIDVTAQVRAR